jgi:hypothetical protein
MAGRPAATTPAIHRICRKLELVIDTGVVDAERSREEAIADDLVDYASMEGNKGDAESKQTRAQKREGHP